MVLLDFFGHLRAQRLPVSVREFLALLDALRHGLAAPDVEQFYYLARCALVKDESLYDRYDKAFAAFYRQHLAELANGKDIPPDWLRAALERSFTPQEKAALRAHGWDELMKKLEERLNEQTGRHAGGNKWIGTGGTSPFGNSGYNPEGVRVGGEGGQKKALKVWEKREFQNLDNTKELGTRNIKIALRRLRKFAREGAADELDIPGTIDGTARQGWLDIKMRPERRNAVKLLLFLDVGGSMDPFIKLCEELFSAATTEFKNLEFFYFHNCPYEGVWKDNKRRWSDRSPMWDILHKYGHDYKVIFVGDASMSPYEITHPGGSVEHFNEEPGAVWMARLLAKWPHAVWINPVKEAYWVHTASTKMLKQMMGERMYPLTIEGLDRAMRELVR